MIQPPWIPNNLYVEPRRMTDFLWSCEAESSRRFIIFRALLAVLRSRVMRTAKALVWMLLCLSGLNSYRLDKITGDLAQRYLRHVFAFSEVKEVSDKDPFLNTKNV